MRDFRIAKSYFVASVSDTAHGELSNSVEAHLNFPLIDDKLAVRLAFYHVKEGGYIDNVPGSKQISLDNPAFSEPPAERATLFNTAIAGKDFNDATFQGIPGGLKYAIDDNWEFLLQHLHGVCSHFS